MSNRGRSDGPSVPILRRVSFEVWPGELVGVLGASGSGKTTLLEILRGAGSPDPGGQVLIAGHCSLDASAQALVGYAPQNDPLHEALTVSEACVYAARLRLPGAPADVIARGVDSAITAVDLQHRRDVVIGSEAHPDERSLSGGERKRASLALELATDARLLLLDEPLSGLSPPDAAKVLDVLQRQVAGGLGVVLVAHEASPLFFAAAHRVLVLGPGGHALFFGTPPELFERFEWLLARELARPEGGRLPTISSPPGPARFWEIYACLAATADLAATLVVSDFGKEQPAAEGAKWGRQVAWQQRARGYLFEGRRQFGTLLARQVRISTCAPSLMRDLGLPAVALGALGAVVMQGSPRPLLGFTAFIAFLFGALPGAASISGEWPVLHRERMAGLHPGAYVAAKLAVLGGLGSLQVGVLSLVVVSCACLPGTSTALYASPLLVFLALTVAQVAGVAVGLAVAGWLRAERAVSLAMVFVLGLVLILSGILIPPSAPINRDFGLLDLNPLRWVYGAILVANRTEDLGSLGLGRDSYVGNLCIALLATALPIGVTEFALRKRSPP